MESGTSAHITVLVDLANFPTFRNLQRPNEAVLGARLDELLQTISERLGPLSSASLLEIRFRLYDGWFDLDGTPSDLHGMLRSHVRNNYPTRSRRRRLLVTIADGVAAAPDERLIDTFRTDSGLGRFHVNATKTTPSECASPAACTMSSLRAWLKGGCGLTGCGVATTEVATFRYQKLVDTQVVADAIWFASHGTAVAIASEDEDVLPGLITARAFGVLTVWITRAQSPRRPYAGLVLRKAIEHIQC